MARPGSREAVSGTPHPFLTEHEEMTLTAEWIVNAGYAAVISLSNAKYAETKDGAFKEMLSLASEGTIQFFHIPHEDHIDNPSFVKGASGPSVEKMKHYTNICLPFIKAECSVVTFCGAGIGRSLANAAALMIAMGSERHKALSVCYTSLTDAGVHERDGLTDKDAIKLELLSNGGAEALRQFESELRDSPTSVTGLRPIESRRWGQSVLGRKSSFDFRAAMNAEAKGP